MAVKVRQHKGAWWLFIDYHGKRKAKRVGSSKRAAEIAAEQIQAKIALGQFAIVAEKETSTLFADYAREWLSTYATVRCKPSSVREYDVVLSRYLIPIFGDTPLSTITREAVKRAVVTWMTGKASRTATLSRARLYAILRLLGGILTSAVEDGKIVANPAAKPGRFLPPRTPVKDHIRALTREELAVLLKTIKQDWPEHFPFFLTLARAGLRLGEAIALQWGDIDWHGGFIGVERGLRKGVLSSTKSKKSRRVDMSRQLKDTLHALQETRKEQAWRNGLAEMPLWVFCTEEGRPVCDATLRRNVLGPALHRAGLRSIRIHDLRHTFASLLIQQGESLTYVKEQMGHHSIQVTVDTYGHLVPGGNRQAVDRLDDPPEPPQSATNRNPAATVLKNTVSPFPLSA